MSIDIFFERSVKVQIQNIDVKVLHSHIKVHLVYFGSGLRITDEGVLNQIESENRHDKKGKTKKGELLHLIQQLHGGLGGEGAGGSSSMQSLSPEWWVLFPLLIG